jgi:nucleoside-diphosphate-sugar epimerase
MKVLIVGGSGNLGSRLARYLLQKKYEIRLLVHRSPVPKDLTQNPMVEVFKADLENPSTLVESCRGIDCVVHLAGVLFAPNPEKFLPITNVLYLRHMAMAALRANVGKFILISFPHVEGETTPESPARGILDVPPSPVAHFRTRLEAEKVLFDLCLRTSMIPVVIRAATVYGPGVKMLEGARWLLKHRILCIWNKPTWIHLIALPDFLRAIEAVISKKDAFGIYNVGDEKPLLLQDFLDRLANHWGFPQPMRLPSWSFMTAAFFCEGLASLFRTRTPITRDFIKAGRVSSVADISRMKKELLPSLDFPTLEQGLNLLSLEK